jgi:hypothetical protein
VPGDQRPVKKIDAEDGEKSREEKKTGTLKTAGCGTRRTPKPRKATR